MANTFFFETQKRRLLIYRMKTYGKRALGRANVACRPKWNGALTCERKGASMAKQPNELIPAAKFRVGLLVPWQLDFLIL